VLGVTGLIGEFGEARVIDTPITESVSRARLRAAVTGLRPVAELMFSDFFGVCFYQIFNQAAKFHMFGGKATFDGDPHDDRRGQNAAAQHCRAYHIFTRCPGSGGGAVQRL
jgi:pyruvate dehydrogenase E1 component beta subunit